MKMLTNQNANYKDKNHLLPPRALRYENNVNYNDNKIPKK